MSYAAAQAELAVLDISPRQEGFKCLMWLEGIVMWAPCTIWINQLIPSLIYAADARSVPAHQRAVGVIRDAY